MLCITHSYGPFSDDVSVHEGAQRDLELDLQGHTLGKEEGRDLETWTCPREHNRRPKVRWEGLQGLLIPGSLVTSTPFLLALVLYEATIRFSVSQAPAAWSSAQGETSPVRDAEQVAFILAVRSIHPLGFSRPFYSPKLFLPFLCCCRNLVGDPGAGVWQVMGNIHSSLSTSRHLTCPSPHPNCSHGLPDSTRQ